LALPVRTGPQNAAIDLISTKLQAFWAAAEEILQYDGNYPNDKAVARAALDSARSDLINMLAGPTYYPNANKGPIIERLATVTELAVASLEDFDLRLVFNSDATSRDVARLAIAACHPLAAAIVCGRI
jgi:hypothetical protein